MSDEMIELAVVSAAVGKMVDVLECEGRGRREAVAGAKQRGPVAFVVGVYGERLPGKRDDGAKRRPATAPQVHRDRYMSKPKKSTELVEGEPTEPGYPRPDESKLEDLPTEWSEEDVELENRSPNLGEMDEDPDEM